MIETLYPLNNSPFPSLPSTDNHHPTFCLYEFDYSGNLIQEESCNICPFVTSLFQRNIFKVHPCCNMSGFPSAFKKYNLNITFFFFPRNQLFTTITKSYNLPHQFYTGKGIRRREFTSITDILLSMCQAPRQFQVLRLTHRISITILCGDIIFLILQLNKLIFRDLRSLCKATQLANN